MFEEGSEEVEWLEGIQRLPHHPVLKQQQPSLFFNTSFDHHLCIKNICLIAVCGFATDICAEFTVRRENALGYHAVMAVDVCGAYKNLHHNRSTNSLCD